jgi:FkbM family methyltransferase
VISINGSDIVAKNIVRFNYDDYSVLCPKIYSSFLEEVFILDVYRTDLLREGDLVLDLGAGTGDFCVIASKKIGKSGKVIAIEPNRQDFELLKANIQMNACKNVIPLNLGVGKEHQEEEMTFRGNKFRFVTDTLENILERLNIKEDVNFIKMDIEGFESDVVARSIEIIKKANVVSVEFHGTTEIIDAAMQSNGFIFRPITTSHIYKKIIKNIFLHPRRLCKLILMSVSANPRQIKHFFTGFNDSRNFPTGSYIKKSVSANTCIS